MRRTDRQVADIAEIKSILDLCKTCHVAMVDDGEPYVVPLSYGYELNGDELTLFFHSAREGHKLEIFRKNKRVCFELCSEGEAVHAEIPCNSGYYFSSVIGHGEIAFIEEAEEKCKALTAIFFRQTGRKVEFFHGQADTVCIYKIVTKQYTGKRKSKPTK